MTVAIVTGGEQGLGAAIAHRLRAPATDVRILSRGRIESGKNAIEEWVRTHIPWPVDILVNNFGINHLSWIGTTGEEDEDILAFNVMTPYWVVNAIRANQGQPCRVLNIASQTHRVPQRTTALYCASKAALVHMTRVMARELAPFGWVVNSLSPGKIEDTKMAELTDAQVLDLRGWTAEQAETYALDMIPMGRFTTCAEVADAAMLMLQMPSYVNGANLDMTGGV